MKHDTLGKLRREELIKKWAAEGRIKLVHGPYINWTTGVHVTVSVIAIQVGEHTFNDAKDLYPSEFLIARIALALEAGQGPEPMEFYGGPVGATGAVGVNGATGMAGPVANGSLKGYKE